ncbi:DUF1801 domain-containing protein [Ferruginibacter sp.]
MKAAYIKIKSIIQLYELLPTEEKIIVDVLRELIAAHLPAHCKEKISYNVPFFYGKKGICIIWPSAIPRGGIDKGVLLGFWYGNRLADTDHYLTHGSNKQIFYKIYHHADDIDGAAIIKLLNEAIAIDNGWNASNKLVLKRKHLK